jgi:hypothetical protein
MRFVDVSALSPIARHVLAVYGSPDHRKREFSSYVTQLHQQTTGRNLLNFVINKTSVVQSAANSDAHDWIV